MQSLDAVLTAMRDHGVEIVYDKTLAENDNSKQQIYLGGSLEAIQQLPLLEVRTQPAASGAAILKAGLDFRWLRSDGTLEPAPYAQVIFYPQYPEVRLSGFLRGAPSAPSEHLRPVPPGQRRFNNGPDGRHLLLGVTPEDGIVAFLALPDSPIARELEERYRAGFGRRTGVFLEFPVAGPADTRAELIRRLKEVNAGNPHQPRRRSARGDFYYPTGLRLPPQAPGYTLEALLGIDPNGSRDPDFLGWELKASSGGKITLMTPEPDGGYYAEAGLERFLERHGSVSNGKRRFTGVHRIGVASPARPTRLVLSGYDPERGRITAIDGGILLTDAAGEIAASWSFAKLLTHWKGKHSRAAYVHYDAVPGGYAFGNPVLLAVGTDFTQLLAAMAARKVYYDPGSSYGPLVAGAQRFLKARNQFRVGYGDLPALYREAAVVSIEDS